MGKATCLLKIYRFYYIKVGQIHTSLCLDARLNESSVRSLANEFKSHVLSQGKNAALSPKSRIFKSN